ncbi:PIR protein CIR protein [Plasmodium vinckei lentum]|uniref:PIR protein CIR protein n=1 Tax=Plasmodium vinckei lentum TaxID=138297 RepID=A0A6V7RWD4_PLAVN|nr:PIR protein CIR protein [Plasmodium vinckei lentum]
MGMKSCNTFSEVDELFTNYEDEFNNGYGSYNNYCPGKNGVRKCETNYEKLGAIFGYAYTELIQNNKVDLYSENDLSADFLVMALSNILYKLSKNHSLSLKDAFEKHINNQGSFNYWSILRNKKYFSGSNIGVMNGFYLLFKQICETISISENPNAQQYEYLNSVAQCHIIYGKLYNFVNHCGPYLQLLNHLKKIYDEFKKAVIKHNGNDESLLNHLIELSPIDTTKFGYEFESSECKQMSKKLEQNISRIKKKSQEEQEEQDEFITLIELLGSDDAEDGNDLEIPKDTKGSLSIDTNNQNPILDTKQGNSNDGSVGGAGDTDKGALNTGNGQNDKGGPVGGSNGDQGIQEGLGGSEGSGDGPDSDPVEKGPQSASWSYFGIGPYISMIASKGKEQLNNAVTSLETIKKKVTETTTNTIQNLYSRSVSNIQAAYDKSRNLLYGAMDNISSYSKQVGNIFIQNDGQSGSGGTGGWVPTSNDSPLSQKDSSQTPSETSQNSLPPPDPKDQTNVPILPQDSPGNQSSDQNHQGGSKIPVAIPMVKQEDTGTEVKGNKTTGIGDIYVLKEYKQIGISIIVLLIPIALAIMHKYLSYGWRKELKRKKTVKKVINSIGGKRPVQIIISSSSRKKQTKKSINSVHRKKPPLLNIYKLMQADPIPFINLFFLLIFFVYKRKYDFLEL